MPKDRTKNVDRYKIRGGELNEFDFHENQEELAEKPQKPGANLIPGTPPERRPAKKTATKTATKSTKAAKTTKSAKKSSTRKAAKK
ncbi:MAG TPA: hypothetical protein VJ875_16775 [Pyrinomonadaceae bacterium]|nr:hypothetical protein [Pyrinomonadaceae bacterium]